MLYGYAGKILHVDLTKGKISTEAANRGILQNLYRRQRDGDLLCVQKYPRRCRPIGS